MESRTQQTHIQVNPHIANITRWGLPILLLTAAVSLVGCGNTTDQTLATIDTSVLSAKTDDLARTMDFVFADRQFDQKDFEEKVSLGLNRWANYSADQAKSAEVDRSEKVNEWIEQNQDMALFNRNDELVFLNTDAYFLQEAFWISKISERVVTSPTSTFFELYRISADNFSIDAEEKDGLSAVVGKAHPQLEEKQIVALAKSIKLSDWVIRNIYLLEELSPNEDEIEAQRLNAEETPWAAGVRGTGYQRHPWQTLMYGRGDYVDRAKVLLMLLREAELDAVMLCVGDKEAPVPWAVGVAIADDYYLFDTKLGLPIPGKTPGSVATLKAAREDANLLSSLDLTIEESLEDDSKYWVNQEQVKSLFAMTYVVPESLSKRMAALESNQVGDERLNLASYPEKEIGRLPKLEGVENLLWDISLRTHRFRKSVNESIPKSASDDDLSDRLRWYSSDEMYVDQFHIYRTNRVRFFKGVFETKGRYEGRNAVESCQVLLYSDDEIDSLATDDNTMAMVGLSQELDPLAFESQLKSIQGQMRLVRRDVGLFLSQCLFDNGNPGTSANWLDGIVRKADVGRWRSGIQYLLGRSFESRREYDLAIEQYQQEDSNQLHGNLIRTRLLKAAVEKAYPGVSLDAKDDDSAKDTAKPSQGSEMKEEAAKKDATEESKPDESESEKTESESEEKESQGPESDEKSE